MDVLDFDINGSDFSDFYVSLGDHLWMGALASILCDGFYFSWSHSVDLGYVDVDVSDTRQRKGVAGVQSGVSEGI